MSEALIYTDTRPRARSTGHAFGFEGNLGTDSSNGLSYSWRTTYRYIEALNTLCHNDNHDNSQNIGVVVDAPKSNYREIVTPEEGAILANFSNSHAENIAQMAQAW